MGLLDGLKTSAGVEEEKDMLMSRGPLSTDLYDMAIDMAYMDKSKGGAMFVAFSFVDVNGKRLKITSYVTSGDAKGNKNTYTKGTGKDKKEYYLPGFNLVNNLCLLTVEKELSDLEPVEKKIMVYDYDEKKDVAMDKYILTDLLGQKITLGVIEQIVDLNEKDAKGKYVPSGKVRIENDLDKAFRYGDGFTVVELRAKATEAVFKDKWAAQNAGNRRDRTAKKNGEEVLASQASGTNSAASTNTAANAPVAEKKSIFDS